MSETQRHRGLILIQFDIENESDSDGIPIETKISSEMTVVASGEPIPEGMILLGLVFGVANWVDESDIVSGIDVLDEMADALDMGPTAGVAGHWTSLDERHYRGLSPLGASASVAKGELVLWSRNDSDGLIWFLTLAGEQIGHHIAEPGEDEDNPPIEWADEVYEALGSEEHTADGGMN